MSAVSGVLGKWVVAFKGVGDVGCGRKKGWKRSALRCARRSPPSRSPLPHITPHPHKPTNRPGQDDPGDRAAGVPGVGGRVLGSPPDRGPHLGHAQLGDGVQEVGARLQAAHLLRLRQAAAGEAARCVPSHPPSLPPSPRLSRTLSSARALASPLARPSPQLNPNSHNPQPTTKPSLKPSPPNPHKPSQTHHNPQNPPTGWSKPNTFHVCITSYTLALQDAHMLKRKKWKYLILARCWPEGGCRVPGRVPGGGGPGRGRLRAAPPLRLLPHTVSLSSPEPPTPAPKPPSKQDEAHMIKNWKSQRWQTLLRFQSKRRLLITGAWAAAALARSPRSPSSLIPLSLLSPSPSLSPIL